MIIREIARLHTGVQIIPEQMSEIRDNFEKKFKTKAYIWGSHFYGDATDNSDLDLVCFNTNLHWLYTKGFAQVVGYKGTTCEFILSRTVYRRQYNRTKVEIFTYAPGLEPVIFAMHRLGRRLTKAERKTTEPWNQILLEIMTQSSGSQTHPPQMAES